jgi:hypothetical protein
MPLDSAEHSEAYLRSQWLEIDGLTALTEGCARR